MVVAIEQGIILESTKARLSELEQRKSELEVSILQEQIKKPFLTKEQIRFGIDKFKRLDVTTKEGKQCLIDGFINAIYLYDDKITFTFNYKDGTQTVSLAELEATYGSDFNLIGAPDRNSLNRSVPMTIRSPFDFERGSYFFCLRRNYRAITSVETSSPRLSSILI